MTADQIRSLQPALAALLETFRPYLGRSSNFGQLLAYVLGLTVDLKRKSIESIALAAGAAVRTLQEFLSFLDWDHEAANARAWTMCKRTWRSPDEIAARCAYDQARNHASYESRKRKAKLRARASREM